MTSEQLDIIEGLLRSEEEPDQMQWVDAVEALLIEVRRLKGLVGE